MAKPGRISKADAMADSDYYEKPNKPNVKDKERGKSTHDKILEGLEALYKQEALKKKKPVKGKK